MIVPLFVPILTVRNAADVALSVAACVEFVVLSRQLAIASD